MIDPYLLLTPVLALGVLALARFVGCDRVFGLVRVPDDEVFPFVESVALGLERMNFTGWVGMAIRVGAKPLTVTELGRTMVKSNTFEHQVKVVRRDAASGGVDVGMVTIPLSAAITPSAANLGFAYVKLQPEVVLAANTDYYVVTHEVANGDAFHDFDTTVTTTDVAEVTSGVFSDDATPNDYRQMGGLGNTYGPVDFKYQEPE